MSFVGDGVYEKISASINLLDTWLENHKFLGWDPHDALNSPLLKKLSFENRLLGIFWVQLLKRLPINLRPLLGVPKGYNPKGMGLFLSSYLRKYQNLGDEAHLERISYFSNWLRNNISPGYSGACWGYNFDWPNRGFYAPKGTPTIINTSFIGLAFLDLYHVLNDGDALKVALSACEFILDDLNVLQARTGEICFSYTPLDQRYIHNANLMGAQLLAEVFVQTNQAKLSDKALAAARYTLRHQQLDGSWFYGEAQKEQWADNFHTGFVLVALKKIAGALDQDDFSNSIQRGYRYWKDIFFRPNGIPKYYNDRLYPIDIHCIAQAILTYLEFREMDPEALQRACHLALWGIENMQAPEGFFYYQMYPSYSIRIPYIRWSQAWMQMALTELLWVT